MKKLHKNYKNDFTGFCGRPRFLLGGVDTLPFLDERFLCRMYISFKTSHSLLPRTIALPIWNDFYPLIGKTIRGQAVVIWWLQIFIMNLIFFLFLFFQLIT